MPKQKGVDLLALELLDNFIQHADAADRNKIEQAIWERSLFERLQIVESYEKEFDDKDVRKMLNQYKLIAIRPSEFDRLLQRNEAYKEICKTTILQQLREVGDDILPDIKELK